MRLSHEELMRENYQLEPAGPHSRLLHSVQTEQDSFFVSAQWLKTAIDERMDKLVVVDVTRGQGNYPLDQNRVQADYYQGHIPGAISLNTDELGGFKDYLIDPQSMRDVFLSKGIDKDSIVVFYSVYARDILYIASRMAFAAYYLGVDQVKILDGGLQAWQEAAYPLDRQTPSLQAKQAFGCQVPARPEIYVRTPEDVLDYLARYPETKLASVRTWKEFIGANQGHAWNKGVGEIAGAVYLGDERLANINGQIAAPDHYLPHWQEWGITQDQRILLYCGTSWRSSTAFFVMKHLGWKKVAMFDGSWYKWYLAHEKEPDRFPIRVGLPLDQ